jgi:hypothetical protein
MTDTIIHSFCAQQREWLAKELESDQVAPSQGQSEEVRSHVLHGLELDDVSVGLYGRTVVRLAATQSSHLPAHRFTTGDEVEIRHGKGSNSVSKSAGSSSFPSGVVCEVTETSISIALFGDSGKSSANKNEKLKQQQQSHATDEDWIDSGPFSLIPKSSIEVHKKLMQALSDLEKEGTGHAFAGNLVQALFEVPSDAHHRPLVPAVTPFNANLDASQIEAIGFALSDNRPVSLIHGPPGSKYTSSMFALI